MDETIRFWEYQQQKPRRTVLQQALEAYIIEIPNNLPSNIKDYAVYFKNQQGLIHYLRPINEPKFKYMVKVRKKPQYRFRINSDNTKVADIAEEIRKSRKKLRIFYLDIKNMRVGYV